MSYDLWDGEGGKKVSATRPQPVKLSEQWTVDPDKVFQSRDGPRRRPYEQLQKPSNRKAVHVPLQGQSYNPEDDAHQEALEVAAKQLEKKRIQHEKFARMMQAKGEHKYVGNLSADKTWEEEVREAKPKREKTEGEIAMLKAKADKKKKKKKKNKLVAKSETFFSMKHKLHPDRKLVLKQLDEIDNIKAAVEKKIEASHKRIIKRKIAREENTAVKKFGRHVHQPLTIDVATTSELTGSLRTVQGAHHHAALERMKSLEERNLVPARMRHNYNKRKVLKPRGEVTIKKEPVGLLLDTSKRQ